MTDCQGNCKSIVAMSLPPPALNQAFCDVSPLEAGHVKAPLAWMLADAKEDESLSPFYHSSFVTTPTATPSSSTSVSVRIGRISLPVSSATSQISSSSR